MKSEVGSAVVSLKKDDRVSDSEVGRRSQPRTRREGFSRPIGKRERTGWELPVSLNAITPGTAGSISEIPS
jgi:hypothetical protein